MTTLEPPPTDAERFRRTIGEVMGLRFEDDRLPWLAKLLEERITATKAGNAARYLERLAARGGANGEVAALAPELCVGETFFFRDRQQFAVVEELIRKWRDADPQGPLRVLSAGSSTGAEAYSIAITALAVAPSRAARDVVIHAIDVSPRAIEAARAAVFSPWALRATPDEVRDSYFVTRGGQFELSETVRRMVTFEQRNLAEDDPTFWTAHRFDLVCCRNVLMYLTPEAARGVVERIARSLTPNGMLFLGHAENLRGLSQSFHLRHTHDTFYYSRRAKDSPELHEGAGMQPVDAGAPLSTGLDLDASWVENIRASAERIAELSRGEADPRTTGRREVAPARPSPQDPRRAMAMELVRGDRFAEALELLSEQDAGDDPDVALLRAVLLATSGDVDTAESLCRRILATNDLDAGAHYVRALCAEHRGDLQGAIEHDRTAAYLDRDFAMPHLHLGLVCRRAGDLVTARRELQTALDLLAREQAPRIVLFGGGFSREALMTLCRAELRACGGGQ